MNPEPHYHINIFFSKKDDCYVADIPDLQYCSAFGDTPIEALNEVLIAQDLYLDSCRRHGDPIPDPRYRPIIYQAAVEV